MVKVPGDQCAKIALTSLIGVLGVILPGKYAWAQG